MESLLTVPVVLFLVSGAVGVFASVSGRRGLLAVFKPLTTLLLLAVVGWPQTPFAWLVVVGILFSLGGDVALLFPSQRGFLVGLGLFLIAHTAYIAGFVRVAWRGWSASPSGGGVALLGWVVLPALVMSALTALLLRKLWAGAAGMRGPLVVYATLLAMMVVAAFAAVGGGEGVIGVPSSLPASAAVGAAIFYVSDASLAVDKFSRPIKHSGLLTLGLYWLGQLGIAVAARIATAG